MRDFSLNSEVEKIRETLEHTRKELNETTKLICEINLLLGSFWVVTLGIYKGTNVVNQHEKVKILAGLYRNELILGLDSLLNNGLTLKEVIDSLDSEKKKKAFELLIAFFKLENFCYGASYNSFEFADLTLAKEGGWWRI